MTIASTGRRISIAHPPSPRPRDGLGALMAAEAFSAVMGFFVLIRAARALGPGTFGTVEVASACAGVVLVLVRGGLETIAQREAARRPRLIGPLTGPLIVTKLAMAGLGAAILALVAAAGHRVPIGIMIASGLILWPASLTADLGARARCRLGTIAAIQGSRAIVLGVVGWFVAGPGDATLAAGLGAVAEATSAVAFGALHVREFGWPRARIGGRATRLLLRRGSVAGLYRLGRVFLFAADVLILGWMLDGATVGPYAAARRLILALAALGLVIPSSTAPAIARAWAEGRSPARRAVARCTRRMMAIALPASVGLMLTASGWMVACFGSGYGPGGPMLAVVAARLPLLLLAAAGGASLIAVRREREALRLVGAGCVAATVLLPIAIVALGPMGAGLAMLGIEAALTIGAWRMLASLEIAPPAWPADRPTTIGVIAMIGVVLAIGDRPVAIVSGLGALGFGLGHVAADRGLGRRAAPR